MDERTDRVRSHTAQEVLRRIDDSTVASLSTYAEHPRDIERRLLALEQEWDTDRALETEAAAMGFFGLALAALARKEFIAIPAVVAGAVLLHALSGRYPLMPLFRRMGLRTAKEIARERYALKALRGDFAGIDALRPASDATRTEHIRGLS